MTPDHGLSPAQLDTIREVLAPYVDKIVRVGVFGSRALGIARPNSDIDLVLFGDIEEPIIDRIRTMFLESSLPVAVDVVAYDAVTYPPMRDHIDRVVRTLLTRSDLIGHTNATPEKAGARP